MQEGVRDGIKQDEGKSIRLLSYLVVSCQKLKDLKLKLKNIKEAPCEL